MRHTIYDQDGNVFGTEELSDVVITVNETGVDVGTSVLTSVGAILSTTSTTYDAAGRVTQTVDASGMVTNNAYDDVGNLISSTEIVNHVSRTTSSTYNALGQVTSTTDALGNTTQYQYNSSGQVTKRPTPMAPRSRTSTIPKATRLPRSIRTVSRRNMCTTRTMSSPK